MFSRKFVIADPGKCIGCKTCMAACLHRHDIEGDVALPRLQLVTTRTVSAPVGCHHCVDAPCVEACPTGCLYSDDERVGVRKEKCIGCRMCMAACPYNARVFNWNEPVRDPDFNYGDKDVPVRGKGVVEKCSLCKERTDRGDEPMCVRCCLSKARTFGDLDDPDSEISRVVRERKAGVLLEEQGTRPQVRYFN